jgi:hypothetical protein
MDDRFAALAEWHDFFAAVAGVAATLVGLLFVALALNPTVMADASPTGLRTWAAHTFHDFLTVLSVALVLLIPDTGEVGLGVPLLLLGLWGVGRVVVDVRRVRSDPAPEWHGRRVLGRFASPLAGYALLVWVGAQVLGGDADSVGWLVGAVFFLMISASSNCWDLLREIGESHRGDHRSRSAAPIDVHREETRP